VYIYLINRSDGSLLAPTVEFVLPVANDVEVLGEDVTFNAPEVEEVQNAEGLEFVPKVNFEDFLDNI
jgi:hypothetical protein